MVIIKLKEVPLDKSGLKDRVRMSWRINPGRLYNEDTLAALYKGVVLEVYKILSFEESTEENAKGRIAFQIEEIESDLKGKKVDYPTANPCTIVETLNFK